MATRFMGISLAALLLASLAHPAPEPRPSLSLSYEEVTEDDGFPVLAGDDGGAGVLDPELAEVREAEEEAPVVVLTPVVVRTLMARITAYCLRGVMRNGEYVHAGAVATDRRVLPEGTRLTIDGLPGIYVSKDTGSGVLGAHVDVWMASCADAVRWGSQTRSVAVLPMG
jgi:3D (Asp-Asp-Asp) domain-containing protein